MDKGAGGQGGVLGTAAEIGLASSTGGMSLGTMGAIGAGLSLATKVAGGEAQKNQINTQMEEEKAANAARGADRSKQLNDVISRQLVSSAAKGLGSGGGSTFRQVSQSSFDSFHEDQARDNLNLSFTESALKSKITAVNVGTLGSFFGAGGKIAGGFFADESGLPGDVDKFES
jgi:hypothetical protein